MSTRPTLQVTESDRRFLCAGWRELAGAYGAEVGTADGWLAALTRHYSGPGRHYHNLHHVAEMLRLLEDFERDTVDYAAVRFAAWFHDAVYDTRSGTNEEESAALAGLALGELGVPPDVVEAARRLILATKRHEAEGDVADLGLFLDADLSILGAEAETYLAYSGAIRREYSWVPDAAYREGRLKVLTNFLGRGRLYYTGRLADRFEARARINLSSEIRALASEESFG
jgi:predicted metal-dependent HD superfamily phosphohydrolase